MTVTATLPSSRTAVQGGSVSLVGQAAKFLLSIAGLVVLGRLLGPADFGLVAMVMAVIGLAEVLRDMGLSSAAMQADTLTDGQRSNLFWINAGLGLALSGLAAGAAGPIAAFYGDPRLVGIGLALSGMFVFNGLQTQFGAELARSMRFTALAVTDLIAVAGALAVAISLAVLGAGYWALVLQVIAQSILALLLRVGSTRWRPGWPNRRDSVRALIGFGWPLMLTQTLIYLSSSIDKVVVGRVFSPAALGLYTRAMQLVVLPTNQFFAPVTNVAVPVLAQLRRDPERFARHVLAAQLGLGYPVAIGLSLAVALADPVLPLVLGQQWTGTVLLFRLLAVSALFQAVNYVLYWIFLTQGRTASHLRYSLVSRSILICCVLLGSTVSLEGVAVGYVVGLVAPWPLALFWVRRWSLVPATKLFRNGVRVVLGGLWLGGVGLAASELVLHEQLLLRILGPLGGVAAGAAMLLCLRVYRDDLRQVLRATRHLGRRRSALEDPGRHDG